MCPDAGEPVSLQRLNQNKDCFSSTSSSFQNGRSARWEHGEQFAFCINLSMYNAPIIVIYDINMKTRLTVVITAIKISIKK